MSRQTSEKENSIFANSGASRDTRYCQDRKRLHLIAGPTGIRSLPIMITPEGLTYETRMNTKEKEIKE